MSAGTNNIVDFLQRHQIIQEHRDSSDLLIQDILVYCNKLEAALRFQNQKLADELQGCKRDNRDLQTKLQNSEARTEWILKEHEQMRSQNAYILVMIDGDGLLFRDQWIRQGVEGGKKAARALHDAVNAQGGQHDQVEVITKVVANFGGLAKSLGRDLSDLKDFALGFTQEKATFDFIDVGHGKDCVSSKIKSMPRPFWIKDNLGGLSEKERGRSPLLTDPGQPADNIHFHLANYNCRHILLGISHDASFAPFLSEIAQDEFSLRRMSIIEGIPTVPELVATNMPSIDLGKDLFRSDKCPDRNASAWPLGSWAAGPRTASPAGSIGWASTPGRSSLSYANAASSSSSSSSSNSNNSPPPRISLPMTPRPMPSRATKAQQYQQIPPQQPDWNPGHRGLDEPITVSVSAMESIKKRRESDKLCNNHFLRGPCTKGDSCFFVHDYKPSSEEINAIAVLARQNPCTNGQDCESDECIYGHHCPSIRDNVCVHPFCKFPEDAHPPGTKFKNPSIKAN
ncbi:CCCH zinc finger DNA binding protein [Metarhizium album ARSEF 1941]|uniref:CCCH zinc finger DNA binding protein n=1 Tax=Metarhizium album (strain ARSEF 1941) TaxID=1081103 RepID=A0A0B2X9F0_METAS|nr:CCCH zinc finger DNA binding protein [Metarhizium album ARSEF 1941]KHO01941.1 CCCH zinc finger DNA binding protein [Metarhizium album ARSEF 1941]